MKILLPVDGSPQALHAVSHALALVAAGLRAQFVLVNVQEPPTLYDLVVVHDSERIDAVRSAVGAEMLQPAEALLSAAGVDWESEVVGGQAGPMLLEMIERCGCDAVVLGSQGAGSLRSAIVGSVSQALLQHSPVPVTVVHLPESDIAEDAAEPGSDAPA